MLTHITIIKYISVKDAVKLYSDADIVGFSLYSWNEQISISIAKKLEKMGISRFTEQEIKIIKDFLKKKYPEDRRARKRIANYIE